VSNFRRLRLPAAPYPALAAGRAERRALPTLVCLAIALSCLLFGAAPASALISGNIGVQSRKLVPVEAKALQYHNGPVMHSSDTYVIYWDPIGNYRGDWQRLIDRYFQDVGTESGHLGDVFALDTQYRDGLGPAANQTTFRGSFKDEDEYPTSVCTQPSTFRCLTDAQIQAELQHVIGSGSLPGATGPPVYYLLTPPGVTVCTAAPGSASTCSNSTKLEEEITKKEPARTGICGYHSAINLGGSSPIPYAVQPWVAGDAGFIEQISPLKTFEATPDVLACQNGAELQEPNQLEGLNPFGDYAEGLADVIISGLSVEQQNVVTDPLLTGWFQSGSEAEQGDMCQRNFGPPPETPPVPNKNTHAANVSNETISGDPYYVQWAFNSSGVSGAGELGCWSGVALEPFFTAPNPVNSGDVVGFNGTESDITLDARTSGLNPDEPLRAPVYSWNFGDGSTASGANAASEFHSYVYGGSYNVTLTLTDGGGNVNETSRTITVVGPAPPTPANPATPGSSSSATSAGTTTGTGTTTGSGSTGKSAARPVATAAISSQSLASVAKTGLAIRYSVNEQVTGRFEVLLASSIARKLGLKGASATGLAKGTPPQTVIAKAILVTTKGGHGTYRLKLSKATAAKLRKLRKVSLMIRMVVHNAASPAVTTVLDTVTLSR
jgi:PKD domain